MPLPPWSVDPGEDPFFKYYGLRQNFLGFVIFVVFISSSLSSRFFFIIIIIIALIIIIILLIIIIDTIIITISGSEQLIFRTNVGLGEGLVSSCSNADIESLSSFIIIISSEHILAQTNMSAYYIVTATFKLSTITQ